MASHFNNLRKERCALVIEAAKRANQGRKFEPIELLWMSAIVFLATVFQWALKIEIRLLATFILVLQKVAKHFGQSVLKMNLLWREVIYYDDEGAVCRCLNWREAQRTMLTEDSQNVVAVMEAINPEQIER